MTEFVPINGKILAYGLTWVTLSHPNRNSPENTALFRAQQTQYFATCPGSTLKVGLATRVIDTAQVPPKGHLLSAALLFVNHTVPVSASDNSLLIHQIDDKKVALIALLKGVPYLDVIISPGALDAQLASLYQEGHTPFVVYGNIPAHATVPLAIDDLLSADTGLATLVRFTDPMKLMRRIGSIAAVCLISGGVAVWKMHKTHQEAAQAARKMMDPVQAYQESTQHLLSLGRFNGSAAYGAIWSVISKREIELSGWSLKQLQCKPAECTETWKQGYGTLAQLTRRLQPGQTVQLQPDGETAAIKYSVTSHASASDPHSLPGKDRLWMELVAQQQRLKRIGINVVFTPKPPEVRGLTPGLTLGSIPPDMLLYAGDMTVTAPLGLAEDILQHHLPDITINDITLTNLDEVRHASLQIKGTYYARN